MDTGAYQGMAAGDKAVPREEWDQFCVSFTQQHEGWLVTIEEQDGNHQERVIAQDQPLQALSYDVDGNRLDVRVVVGSGAGETLAHVVPDARSIHLQFDDRGAHGGLSIRSLQGITTVRFRSPAPSDTVNGLP